MASTARAERTQRPYYLETFGEANVRFCQRHGFDWFMQRPWQRISQATNSSLSAVSSTSRSSEAPMSRASSP